MTRQYLKNARFERKFTRHRQAERFSAPDDEMIRRDDAQYSNWYSN